MSYRNFLDELGKGLPSACYLLVSSDTFLHTEAAALIKKLVPDEERAFNFQSFDLISSGHDSIPFEQIIDVLNTVPFFAARKFVVVENFQKILKKDFERLGPYLSNPSESSTLILLNTGTVRKNFAAGLKGIKKISLDIRESEIPFWLKQKAKAKGFQITDNAVKYLLGTVGPDIGMLSSELDKCMLIGKKSVDRPDIEEITIARRTYNVFSLVNAIKANDAEAVFRIYSVLRATEEPYSLLGALNWQYSQFMTGKITPEEKTYYYDIFQLLHEADMHIKSSGGFYPVELLLTRLLSMTKPKAVTPG